MGIGSYRKGLLLSLGSILQTQVDLHAVRPGRSDTSLKRLCPNHHQPLKQSMKCLEGPHDVDTWVMGRENPDGWQIVEGSRPEFEAADVLELTPVPATDLEANTFYGESIYYAQPSNLAGLQAWQVLHDLLAKHKIALVAKAALRRGSTEKLWRLDLFRGYIVLRELVYPDDIRDVPEQETVKLARPLVALVNQFVDQLVTKWDNFDTTNVGRERLEEWIGQGTVVAKQVPADETQNRPLDLMAALQAAVETTKKKNKTV